MTQDQIDRIKAYCEKATPGPWETMYNIGVDGTHLSGLQEECYVGCDKNEFPDDMLFIANARTDIPLLVQHVEQLRKDKDELRAVLLKCRDTVGIYISCAGHHSDGDDPCPRCQIASEIDGALALHPTSKEQP